MIPMRRIGLFCGMFNPIHEGHLKAAAETLSKYALDTVCFYPMEAENSTDLNVRRELCRAAVQSEEKYRLINSISEIDQDDSECYLICESDDIMAKDIAGSIENLHVVAYDHTWQLEAVSAEIRNKAASYEDSEFVPLSVLKLMAEKGLYQRNDLPKLQTMMNVHRFQHTLGVRREAVRLAGLHHVSIQKAALAGVLHDCAKGMKLEALQQMAIQNDLVEDEELLSSNAMLHGPVGAYIAQTEFSITDPDVLAAIRNHTLGRPGMTPLELTIFVADATEAGREPYEGLEEIRRLSDISLRCAALKSMHCTRVYLEREKRSYCKLAHQTELDLLRGLTETERMELRRAKYAPPRMVEEGR